MLYLAQSTKNMSKEKPVVSQAEDSELKAPDSGHRTKAPKELDVEHVKRTPAISEEEMHARRKETEKRALALRRQRLAEQAAANEAEKNRENQENAERLARLREVFERPKKIAQAKADKAAEKAATEAKMKKRVEDHKAKLAIKKESNAREALETDEMNAAFNALPDLLPEVKKGARITKRRSEISDKEKGKEVESTEEHEVQPEDIIEVIEHEPVPPVDESAKKPETMEEFEHDELTILNGKYEKWTRQQEKLMVRRNELLEKTKSGVVSRLRNWLGKLGGQTTETPEQKELRSIEDQITRINDRQRVLREEIRKAKKNSAVKSVGSSVIDFARGAVSELIPGVDSVRAKEAAELARQEGEILPEDLHTSIQEFEAEMERLQELGTATPVEQKKIRNKKKIENEATPAAETERDMDVASAIQILGQENAAKLWETVQEKLQKHPNLPIAATGYVFEVARVKYAKEHGQEKILAEAKSNLKQWNKQLKLKDEYVEKVIG